MNVICTGCRYLKMHLLLDTSQTPGTNECLVSFVSSSRFGLLAAQNPFFHLLLNCVVLEFLKNCWFRFFKYSRITELLVQVIAKTIKEPTKNQRFSGWFIDFFIVFESCGYVAESVL